MRNDTSRNSIKFPEESSIFAFISIDSCNSRREHSNVVSPPDADFWRILLSDSASKKKGKTPWEHSPQPPFASATTSILVCLNHAHAPTNFSKSFAKKPSTIGPSPRDRKSVV